MTSFKRPKTAQEAVLAELRTQLLDGRLPPGSAIRPDAVGAELGVSAVPVREALRILEGEGHVASRPHRGYLVTELDLEDLTEIYRIRELLEVEAVSEAIPKMRKETIASLQGLIVEMEEVADNVVLLTAVNRRFHFALFEAAEMPQLVNVLRILWDSADRYRARYLMDADHRHLVNKQHRRIMAAIVDGKVELVVDEMRQHREHAISELANGGLPVRKRLSAS